MKTFKYLMLIWHSWRASWWESLMAQAKRMRDFHEHSRQNLHRELFPPKLSDRAERAIKAMNNTTGYR